MTDEPESLVLRLLQEIRAKQDEHSRAIAATKDDIALIKDKMVQQSLQLSSQSGSLGEIAHILSHLPDWMQRSPADISEQLRDLQERVAALENRRQ